jgi:hypothetical protein
MSLLKGRLNSILNWCWLIWHWRDLQQFRKQVDLAGYRQEDIWWNRQIGFRCFPPSHLFEEDDAND